MGIRQELSFSLISPAGGSGPFRTRVNLLPASPRGGVESICPLPEGNTVYGVTPASALPVRGVHLWTTCADACTWRQPGRPVQSARSQKATQTQTRCFTPGNSSESKPLDIVPVEQTCPYELGRQLCSTVLCSLPSSLHVTRFHSWSPAGDVLCCMTQSCRQNRIQQSVLCRPRPAII